MSTNTRVNKMFFAIAFAVMLLSMVAVILPKPIVAFADTITEGSDTEELCRIYTNSKNGNGVNFNEYISDFNDNSISYRHIDVTLTGPERNLHKSDTYGSNVQYSGAGQLVKCRVYGDDNIVKLIPRDLFKMANRTLYIGKEYGFFIITTLSDDGRFFSTVILIDVIGDVSDYLADITLNICATMDFAFVTTQTSSIPRLSMSTSTANLGSGINIICENGVQSAVIPIAGIRTDVNTGDDYLGYYESKKYSISNISFAGMLRNHNAINQGELDYDVSDDKGYFFTGNNYYYSATRRTSTNKYENGISQFGAEIINAGLDLVASEVVGAMDMPLLVNVAGSIIELGTKLNTIVHGITYKETNGKYGYGYDAQYLPNTKHGQISAYGNLVKASHMILNGTSNDIAYFMTGDFANAQFSYSHTDGVYNYTQLALSVGATIYDVYHNQIATTIAPTTYYDINTAKETSVVNFDPTDYYMLPYGSQTFNCLPVYSGDYVLTGIDASSIEVYVNGTKQNRQSGGKYSLHLTGGNNYTIVLKNKSYMSDCGQFLLMPKDVAEGSNSLTLDANSTSVVKFVPTISGIYTINMPNAVVKDVLARGNNSLFGSINTLSSNDNTRDTLSAYFKSGTTYLIVLKNTADNALNGTLSISQSSASWSVGTNEPCAVYPDATYHSFTVPADDTATVDYVFTFTNAQNINFIVVDEDGVVYRNTIEKSNGWLLLKSITPGKTYYIGIYGEQNIDVIPACAKNEGDTYTWKIYDGNTLCSVEPSGRYILQRGKSYTVTLWVNNDYKYTDIFTQHDSIDSTTTSVIYDINTGKLTLTADRDIKSTVVLSADGAQYADMLVETDMNPNEISMAIDCVDKIQANFTKSDFVSVVNITLSGKNAYGTSFSKSYSITDSAYTTGVKDLYSSLAVGVVTIKVDSVKLVNKYNTGEFTRAISHVSSTVDCSSTDIYNALQFYNIRYHDSDRFKVKNSIDFSTLGENVNWTPIPELNGVIVGNYYILKGIKMVVPASVWATSFGLIRTITETGSVIGLVLHDVSLTSDVDHDKDWITVGGIAGQNSGTVSFCTVKGSIACNRNCASIGGIIGANSGTVGFNSFVGTVYGNGDMGGIIGTNLAGDVTYNSVTDSFVKHYVVDEARSVGGVVGYCCGGSVASSTVKSTSISIENTSDVKNIKTRMGFVIGHLSGATMKNNNTIENCTKSTGKLKKTDYCFKYYDGQIGNMSDATVE